MTLILIGLCGGGQDSLTLGALERLRKRGPHVSTDAVVMARIDDGVVSWLKSSEGGVEFDSTFDSVPYPSLEQTGVIFDAVMTAARVRDTVYLVPGHPVLGERSSTRLYIAARAESIPLRIMALDPEPERDGLTDFSSLTAVMEGLRHPETGCPWDLEQTHATLRRYLIEEAYEVIEAIDLESPQKLAEELGDFLLQAVFHAQLASESGRFDIGDVIERIVEKLIRRHPHVFGDVTVDGAEQVLTNWEIIKRSEKGNENRVSILDGIPKDLPALMRAMEVSKRVVKVGFEWPTLKEVLDKVEEEIAELRLEIAEGDKERAGAEMGDVLFTLVNVSRQLHVDPEEALRAMTFRFASRFRRIEEHAASTGRTVDQMSLDEMESVWQAAKKEKTSGLDHHIS
jgi:tetrapyrrole methylase family protein/MazG family protein